MIAFHENKTWNNNTNFEIVWYKQQCLGRYIFQRHIFLLLVMMPVTGILEFEDLYNDDVWQMVAIVIMDELGSLGLLHCKGEYHEM